MITVTENNLNLSRNVEVFSSLYDQELEMQVVVKSYKVNVELADYGRSQKVVNVDWDLYTPNNKYVNKYEFSKQIGYLQEVAEYLACNDADNVVGYMQEAEEVC